MEKEFIKSPHFKSKEEREISLVIIHCTDGDTLDGCVSWFKSPESKVSAHYIIDRNGKIVQMVDDIDVAWHSGKSTWLGRSGCNEFSIGIELVGREENGFTPQQFDSLVGLCVELFKTYEFDINELEKVFVGHKDVAPGRKTDPGDKFDWKCFYGALKNEIEVNK